MSVNPAPVNFDPATHPILSRHWFGAEREALDAGGDGFWPIPIHEVRPEAQGEPTDA